MSESVCVSAHSRALSPGQGCIVFVVVILCDLRVKTPEVIQMAGALGIIQCHSVILQM